MTTKYICPRCDYSSIRKTDVSRHFQRKIPCPSSKSNIVLTPEIIKHVLTNHSYEPPETQNNLSEPENFNLLTVNPLIQESSIIVPVSQHAVCSVVPIDVTNVQINNNTQNIVNINNNNQKININKLVIQTDSIDKIREVVKYQAMILSGVDITFENTFQNDCEKWIEGSSDFLGLKKFDLLDYVNRGVEAQSPAEFNIVHKTNPNRICIYYNGEWESYLEERGVHKVIEHLRLYAFNEYEFYLLKKLHTALCGRKTQLTICLETYYNFLICFDMSLHAENAEDQYIMGYTIKEDNPKSIEGYAIKLYNDIKQTVTKAEKKKLYKEVLHIIKGSSDNNMAKVNTAMMNILNIDQEFREHVINKDSPWAIQAKPISLAITS